MTGSIPSERAFMRDPVKRAAWKKAYSEKNRESIKNYMRKLAREIFLSQGRVTRAGDVAGHLAATVS